MANANKCDRCCKLFEPYIDDELFCVGDYLERGDANA